MKIAWEHPDLVALFKPSGLPVFAPHADKDGDCLAARWRVHAPEQAQQDWPDGFALGIAHRLDVPTSGLVLAARTPRALQDLRALFSGGSLEKRYRFVTARNPSWESHEVSTPIAHDKRRKSRMIVQRGQSTPHRGRWYPAHTRFQRLGPVDGGWLWQAIITTGVMHQIRVHAASVWIPLLGDRRYGGGAPPAGQSVDFLLHHTGLSGPGLRSPDVPTPDFWPSPR